MSLKSGVIRGFVKPSGYIYASDDQHYYFNKDGIIDDSDLNIAKNKVKELKKSIAGVTISSNRVDKAIKEIKRLEEFIVKEDDEYTKTY